MYATRAYLIFIRNREGEVLDTFTEVESGKKANRPGLYKVLRRCKLTGAMLVIAKLDRLNSVRNVNTSAARASKEQFAAERNAQLRAIISEIKADANTPMSLAQAAADLKDACYSTARGKQFTKGQINRIKEA